MNKDREFVDDNRDVSMSYYDLCDVDTSTKANLNYIKKELKKLIKSEPYFLDSYSHLYQLLLNEDKVVEARELINMAYGNALELVLDKAGNWPDLIEWGWIENRHIIRAILNKGIDEWMFYRNDVALDIFRKLLRTNPRDNAGVRFYILAILMKMSFEEYEEKFNKGGHYDDSSWKWFEKNCKKFANEFTALE